jgi:hypothetical protein
VPACLVELSLDARSPAMAFIIDIRRGNLDLQLM